MENISLLDHVLNALVGFQDKEEIEISLENWKNYNKKDMKAIILQALKECPYEWISEYIDQDLESGDLKITFTDDFKVIIYEKDYSDTIDE